MSKTAIVLFNLGGPDSKAAIRPFLFNFFTDPNIIRLPYPFRFMIACLIAWRRSKKEAGDSYGELGDKSPLLENSQAQADALDALLNARGGDEYKSFIAMRYWHPMADETAQKVKDWNPDRIVLLPLYPQYSTTTTRSSFQVWTKACDKIGLHTPFKLVCCYPSDNGFIRASADNVRAVYEKALAETGQRPRVLFSAHGLPEDIVKDGDPYQAQCEASARDIAAATGIEGLDWQICYQSRVGPKKWLGPSTEEALKKAASDHVPVVILPHAFTQEHVETLVEIEIEYREMAEEMGLHAFYRVPTVGVHPLFIEGLANMVAGSTAHPCVAPDTGARICPSGFKNCAMQEFAKFNAAPSCCGCAGH
ncbi:MAG: ferrochelatase [Micavibrio aeruginosavorus]|uniref:Ferrochelatase n=1 Tax=Micavibrio aeruginosavorus TaxID=349221 RepID=A0A2W5A2M5_9BACT|nr:MAG: ferrochelatase [Micavibrio aeruginosavorus]